MKQDSKSYTNRKRHVTEQKLQIGDQVLVKQRKLNKLMTSFDIVPYYVTAIKGTMVTAQATSNNISHFKPLPKTAELPKLREEEEDEEDKRGNDSVNRNNEIPKEYPRHFRRPVLEKILNFNIKTTKTKQKFKKIKKVLQFTALFCLYFRKHHILSTWTKIFE